MHCQYLGSGANNWRSIRTVTSLHVYVHGTGVSILDRSHALVTMMQVCNYMYIHIYMFTYVNIFIYIFVHMSICMYLYSLYKYRVRGVLYNVHCIHCTLHCSGADFLLQSTVKLSVTLHYLKGGYCSSSSKLDATVHCTVNYSVLQSTTVHYQPQ